MTLAREDRHGTRLVPIGEENVPPAAPAAPDATGTLSSYRDDVSRSPDGNNRRAASTLVVSQDLDIGVPVNRHDDVKRRLPRLLADFAPSPEEPSVWTSRAPELLEVNVVGIDPARGPQDAYVLQARHLALTPF